MPYLSIQTNKTVDTGAQDKLLLQASGLIAGELGKPESYVMTSWEPVRPMTFAGNAKPCAYLEMKSIALPETKTAGISKTLCGLIENELGIPANRIYIEFSDAARSMWGWDNRTF